MLWLYLFVLFVLLHPFGKKKKFWKKKWEAHQSFPFPLFVPETTKPSGHTRHDMCCKPKVKDSEALFQFSNVLMHQSWKHWLGLEETLNFI